MKAERLLAELLLFQAHGRMTGRELAERLEVSQRTVHRDMEALSAAGVPIFALRGAKGGWQLEEGWRTRVPGLDEGELRALLMAQPRALGESHLVEAAERALNKLLASLPTPLREQASSLQKRLHVDPTGWRGDREDLSKLAVVQDAVARDLRLEINYRARKKDRVDRTVDPLGLVAKGGTWYLVAGTPGGVRTFRVSRIERARLLEQRCERPLDFDLASYWEEATQELRHNWARYETTLRLDPSAAESMRGWWDVSTEDEVPDEEGWVTLRVRFEDEEQALFVVLGTGPLVEVLEPQALRERVAESVAAMAERVGRPG